MSFKEQILHYESRLLDAIKSNDLNALDKLLHDDLLFIIPTGQTITKAMDLANFRSGNIIIETISSDGHEVSIIDDTAIVSMNVAIKGRFFDHVIDSNFRYLRVWKLFGVQWKVIGGAGMQA